MAFLISGYGSLALSLKVALISTAVLLLSFAKFSFPLVTDFAVSQVPIMYTSFISWLRPPYLYLIINGIIISIVASSKLHHKKHEQSTTPEINIIPPSAKVVAAESEYDDLNVTDTVVEDKEVIVVDGAGGDEAVSLFKSTQPLERSDSIEFLAERQNKPFVSARFGSKKSVKSNPEGGKAAVLGVSKWRRHDTLESTWKMITDGRPMRLARHLKKSDTWDSHGTTAPPVLPMPMNKSETFTETNNTKSSKLRQGSGKLKKEPSLSQDELNRRVEAFIKKFNEEMRLQRQESLNQYREMVSSGGAGAY